MICHKLMHQHLPLAVKKSLQQKFSLVLIEVSNFFIYLCSKVRTVEEFAPLKSNIPLVLSHLENVFPPLFFDITIHLPIHLGDDAKIARPVQ